MASLGHYRLRPAALPRSIPPFPGETTSSYLARLAAANKLTLTTLRILLTGTPGKQPIDAHDLAAASGRSVQSLRHALPELAPGFTAPSGRPVLISRRRPCRRCTTRRGITVPVICWLPTEITVCRPHHIWLGAPTRPSDNDEQHDLTELPQLIQAQRRHTRLVRSHGRRIAAEAFTEAAHVTSCWAHRGFPDLGRYQRMHALCGAHPTSTRLRRGDPLIPVVTYPETVALASVLAQPQWRYPPARYNDHAQAGRAILDFGREVNRQIGHWIYDGAPDPLGDWFYKRRRLAEEDALSRSLFDTEVDGVHASDHLEPLTDLQPRV